MIEDNEQIVADDIEEMPEIPFYRCTQCQINYVYDAEQGICAECLMEGEEW